MAKIEITKTELVWPGKYNEDGMLRLPERVILPFQVIETINESRATREARNLFPLDHLRLSARPGGGGPDRQGPVDRPSGR